MAGSIHRLKKWMGRHPYSLLVLGQLCLLLLAFPQHMGLRGAMFCNSFDGFKNYFTLLSYVKEPIGPHGLLSYTSFAYPFGDYVFYTDNTPFFAVPFKWFCHHIADISAYALPAYNWLILSNFIWASLITFFIFRRVIGSTPLAAVLAMVLPWVNMQCPRIWIGHFNLSCSALVLLPIALFLSFVSARTLVKQVVVVLAMTLSLVGAFLVHGYYIAVLGVFLSAMLGVFGLSCKLWRTRRLSLACAALVPGLALTIALTLIKITDGYFALRKDSAMGYDHSDLKTNFLLLFTHYDFHHLAFPIASTMPRSIEGMSYLGNIGLFILGGLFVGCVANATFRKRVLIIQRHFFADPIKKAIFWAGMLGLLISFGEYYDTNRDEIKLFTPFTALNSVDLDLLLSGTLAAAIIIYQIVLATNRKVLFQFFCTMQSYTQQPLRKISFVLIVGLVVYLFIGRYSVTIPNVANPFFYLHFITKRVEQFRCLSRFAWPFFWSFYVWVMYTGYQLYLHSSAKTRRLLTFMLLAVGAIETGDYVIQFRHAANNANLLAASAAPQPTHINYKQYQAILPLPFYMVGSEDYDVTIDDDNNWGISTMQASLASGLPLMACKMSRTPPAFSRALLDFVAYDRCSPILLGKLDSKPILVMLERDLLSKQAAVQTGTKSAQLYEKAAATFIGRHGLRPIDSLGHIFFYRYQP